MATRRRRRAAHRAARQELLGELDETPEQAGRGPRRRGWRRSTAAAPERRRSRPRRPDGHTGASADGGGKVLWWVLGWLVITVGVCIAVGVGAPTLGHGTDVRYLVAGSAATVCGAAVAAGHRPGEGRRGRSSVPAVAVAVCLCFAVGAANSLIIDGRPVLATSTEARAHQMVRTMEADMMALVVADEMIALPISEARARSREYEELAAQMESLSARWARTELSELPTGEFAPIGRSLATASFAAHQAVEAKIKLLSANDARVTAEMNAFRQTLGAEVLASGPELVALGELYDVEVRLGAPTVKE